MAIIYAEGNAPIDYTQPHDPDESIFYAVAWRPKAWLQSTEYIKQHDIVTPTSNNGYVYVCSQSGISGATEPTWNNKTVTDGTIVWQAMDDNSKLRAGDTITLSTWTVDDVNITLSDDVIISGVTLVKVSDVPSTLETFTLTNSVTITRVNGMVEKFDRSLIVTVKTL